MSLYLTYKLNFRHPAKYEKPLMKFSSKTNFYKIDLYQRTELLARGVYKRKPSRLETKTKGII